MISIHLSANPSPDELRKAREILALVADLANEPETVRAPLHGVARDVQLAPVPPVPTATDAFQTHVPAPAPAPPAPVAAVFDKTGLPWDERIHSSTKGTNQDGTFKKRRGVDDATVAAVERELRIAQGGPQEVAPAAPPPPAPVAAAAPPPPPPADAGPNFISIMRTCGVALAEKRLTQPQIVEALAGVGISDGLVGLGRVKDDAGMIALADMALNGVITPKAA